MEERLVLFRYRTKSSITSISNNCIEEKSQNHWMCHIRQNFSWSSTRQYWSNGLMKAVNRRPYLYHSHTNTKAYQQNGAIYAWLYVTSCNWGTTMHCPNYTNTIQNTFQLVWPILLHLLSTSFLFKQLNALTTKKNIVVPEKHTRYTWRQPYKVITNNISWADTKFDLDHTMIHYG